MEREEIRLECLKLACGQERLIAEVLARAGLYEKFIVQDVKTEFPSETKLPAGKSKSKKKESDNSDILG